LVSVSLTESVPKILSLTSSQAAALNALGNRLVTSPAASTSIDEDDALPDASLIRCHGLGDNQYRLTVADAVGIVACDDLVVEVGPKIPPAHLRYLMERSRFFGSTARGSTSAAPDRPLWELVIEWYLLAVEVLLKRGLLADYDPLIDQLAFARGSIRAVETAEAFYRGTLLLDCEFEEFSEDAPLNRLLLSALNSIIEMPGVRPDLRRRGVISRAQMSHVGPLRPSDLRVVLDRRSHYYDDAHKLALHVLASTGRTFTVGSEKAWSFLVRTPLLVEEAIRHELRAHLGGVCKISKRPVPIDSTGMTLNPDLMFGSIGVGDVKYKVPSSGWIRPDLYQLTTFAVGCAVESALLVAFATEGTPALPDVKIGDVCLHPALWDTSRPPEVAAANLVDEVRNWLDTAIARRGRSHIERDV